MQLLRFGLSFLIVLVTACTDGGDHDGSAGTSAAPSLEITTSAAPIELSGIASMFSADVRYGEGERNLFDIYRPDSDTPTPLVIYYHGGGYTQGDKDMAHQQHADDIREILQSGVAFATVNYHLLSLQRPLDPDGVIHSLEDSARALQFMRYHAASLNIDPEQIATYGVSAGASTSLWLATHDDMADAENTDPVLRESTRVKAIAALHTQSTLDVLKWEQVLADALAPFASILGGTDIPTVATKLNVSDFLFTILGVESMEEIYGLENAAYRDNIDILELMDAGDAPIYAYNVSPALEDLVNLFLHHSLHARALHERAQEVGLHNVVYAYDPTFTLEDPSGEKHISFLLRHIR